MKHLVIFTSPRFGRSWRIAEMPMPQEGFSDPATYQLPADITIECVIHNIRPECTFSIIQPVKATDAQVE